MSVTIAYAGIVFDRASFAGEAIREDADYAERSHSIYRTSGVSPFGLA